MQSHSLSQLLSHSFTNIVASNDTMSLLHFMKSHFDCDYVTITTASRQQGMIGFVTTDDFTADLTEEYRDSYFGQCPRMQAFFGLAAGGSTNDNIADRVHGANGQMSNHYRDWLARAACEHSVGMKLDGDRSWQRVLSLNWSSKGRSAARHAFPQSELIAPHLANYVAVRRSIDDEKTIRLGLDDRHNSGRSGYALVDSSGHLIDASPDFEEFLAMGQAMRIQGNMLVPTMTAAAPLLRQLLDYTMSPARPAVIVPPLRLVPPGGYLGFVYRVVALDGADGSLDWSHARALLSVTNLDARPEFSTSALMQMFSLTRREAQVAEQIANGRTTSDVAMHLQISIDTVRQHMKSIFAKTETGRQIDLARLITGIAH